MSLSCRVRVSVSLFYKIMSYLNKLKCATSRKELAETLGYKPSNLTFIVYRMSLEEKYTVFNINKKSGGTRTIKAPTKKLKKLQLHLANLLYACLNEIEQEKKLNPVSFGFRKNRSIIENAAHHKRRRWVLNIDLEDFFPSFNFGRVRGFFIKDNSFKLCPEVATTIAQIACDGVSLPQGSPCSPVISELISQILDRRLVKLSKKYGVRYTRYADDISFSTNKNEFPYELAKVDADDPSIWHLSEDLITEINHSGFEINRNKTRMCFFNNRQTVTGLVVNEKVNIPSEYYRRARAMCDSLFETGEYFKQEEKHKEKSTKILEGILSYIYYIKKNEDKRSEKDQADNPLAIRKLYRRFLFYKYFVALNETLIVTEGKTDPVYLKCAIKNLKTINLREFGELSFLKHSDSIREIFGFGSGGTNGLVSIFFDYRKYLHPNKKEGKAINHKPMLHPVIMVLDNDDGLKPIASALKKFNIEISKNTTKDFYHIFDNLYIVKMPEKNEDTCIEDLFSKDFLSKKINDKKFSSSNKIDPEKEFGKEIFAKQVINNQSNIDFSGFEELIGRLKKVVLHYHQQTH